MRAFLAAHFPSVPADDIIQETLIALVRAMPSYVYSPKEKGFFHNYLFGVLKHKALHHLRDASREEAALDSFASVVETADAAASANEAEDKTFRESIYELARAELLPDPSTRQQSRPILVRVAINGEKPEDVAAAFGVTRKSVDQTKARLVAKLRRIKEGLVISG